MVVDDQALMRTGFRMILESADGIDVVAEADNGITAVTEAERSTPDVILMDHPHAQSSDGGRGPPAALTELGRRSPGSSS